MCSVFDSLEGEFSDRFKQLNPNLKRTIIASAWQLVRYGRNKIGPPLTVNRAE